MPIIKIPKPCCAAFWFLLGAFFWHFIAVVFGAPLNEKVEATFIFAVLLSTCTVLIPASIVDDWFEIGRIYFEADLASRQDHFLFYTWLGSIVGAWLGAFPIPLDWDRWWQEWPYTCVAGVCLGFPLGALLGEILYRRRISAYVVRHGNLKKSA